MPTSSGDTFPDISHSIPLEHLLSPSQHQLSNRASLEKEASHVHNIEIAEISPRESTLSRERYISESPNSSRQPPDLVLVTDIQPETQRLISSHPDYESEPDSSQMGRKPHKTNATSPDQARSTSSGSQNGHLNGHLHGHINGHANGNMNKNVEMRRKHIALDSPTQTANLMGRESFSLDNEPPPTPSHASNTGFFDLPRQDRRNFLLLVLLYFLQGVPMGLAGGSVPFLLKKAHLSYGQIGVFTLASYPYSLKLLWSPIVDAVWSPALGRRKSWILPIQLCSGLGMIYLGGRAAEMMKAAGATDGSGIWRFTLWWFFLVFLCATQDIAVDGWALTLLSPPNLSYASTAQTVGLTAGQFLSFTVFLAFNAPEFANRWFRKVPLDEGVMSLGGYLAFWGWAYLIVTIGLAIMKREEKTKERDGIMTVYRSMWGILKLRNIQSIIIIHLIAKLGFQANDAATNLKLLDKGFSQEDMALTVLIDFPFEISLGYYAGRWSTAYPPIHVWCWGFIGRLVAAVIAQAIVLIFPKDGVQTWYLLSVICSHIFSTFTNTVMFVAISAFHAKISDPAIGGTYMTLLAT